MPRFGSAQFAFPEFSGATRRLILWNLVAFFVLLLANAARLEVLMGLIGHLALRPEMVFAGEIWQPLTYSFVHPSLIGTLFELLSLWFLAGFLESMHGGRWSMGLRRSAIWKPKARATQMQTSRRRSTTASFPDRVCRWRRGRWM